MGSKILSLSLSLSLPPQPVTIRKGSTSIDNRPFPRVIIRTCAETNSARETTPLGGIAECGMSDYYKKLDSIAKTRYLNVAWFR